MQQAQQAAMQQPLPSLGAGGPPGQGGEEIDVAVLQYAQWLSEIKHRATSSQQQQSGEIGMLKEGLTTHQVQMADFKRHCTSVLAAAAERRDRDAQGGAH